MEIRYCECEIPQRGQAVALKFQYDREMIEALKAILNRYRVGYSQQTRKPAYQAGGWLPEMRVWYVAKEIWGPVSEELLAKGHGLVQVFAQEAFFGKQSAGSQQQREE